MGIFLLVTTVSCHLSLIYTFWTAFEVLVLFAYWSRAQTEIFGIFCEFVTPQGIKTWLLFSVRDMSLGLRNTCFPNSPRASNTFNQVAEAKRFEGVFFM